MLALISFVAGCAGAPADSVIADFEADAPSWEAVGDLVAQVETSPDGSSALRIRTPGDASCGAPAATVPADWSGAEALSLRVHRSSQAPPTQMEVRIGSATSGTWFRRDVELLHAGWSELFLPLAWFRPGGRGRAPRWDQITDLVVRFDGPADVWLDDVALIPSSRPHPAVIGPDDVIAFSFQEQPVRVHRNAAVDIVTDVPELDVDQLAEHLATVGAAIRSDLPFLPEPIAPPLLVVTSTRERQLALIDALVDAAGARLGNRPDLGFTILGVATAPYDPAIGTLRPVFTHEYVHSLLDRIRALPDDPQDWLNVGLAWHYQVRFHAESAPEGRGWMEGDLRQVFEGGTVENRDGGCARAESTFDLLLHDARYAPAVPALFDAFGRSGSSALGPRLEHLLGVDEHRFSADWHAWVSAR